MQLISLAKKFLRLVGTACTLALLTAADGTLAQPSPQSARSVNSRPQFGQSTDSFTHQLRNVRFRERLNLTEEQTRKLDQLRMELFTAFRNGGSNEELPRIAKEFDQKVVDLLTAEQQRIWEERQAELKPEIDAAIAAAVAKEKEAVAKEKVIAKLLTEMKALQKDRRDTLAELAKAGEQRFHNGQATLASAMQASYRQFDAALEFASTKEERVASYESLIENLRQLEKDAESIHRDKAGPIDDVLEAKAARLKAEIDLLKLRVDMK